MRRAAFRILSRSLETMPKYYAVRVGRAPGIYNDWGECENQVKGFAGAAFKSFKTYEEAIEFINDGSRPLVATGAFSKSDVEKREWPRVEDVVPVSGEECLYVDGGCNNFTKDCGFGSVVNQFGNDLLGNHGNLIGDLPTKQVVLPVGERFVLIAKFDDVATQQNNGAELLAMVAGLRIAIFHEILKLYSDSSLLILFWSKGLSKTKRETMDARKVRYIDELIHLRRRYEAMGGQIIKVSGDINKADLGFH